MIRFAMIRLWSQNSHGNLHVKLVFSENAILQKYRQSKESRPSANFPHRFETVGETRQANHRQQIIFS